MKLTAKAFCHAAIASISKIYRSRNTKLMAKTGSDRSKYAAFAASLLAAGSIIASSLFVPAFAQRAGIDAQSLSKSVLGTFTPAGMDSRLLAKYGKPNVSSSRFQFTPAGIGRSSRTMTVAARTGSQLGGNAISVRESAAAMQAGRSAVVVHPSDYRLTSVRGWQGFTMIAGLPKASAPAPLSEIVGKGSFRLDDDSKTKGKPSRFSPKISLDQNRTAAPPARGTTAAGDYSLDLGGSFSITRKVDLTAGVRYNSERDRVAPQPTDTRADSEAVYVGTKIRF